MSNSNGYTTRDAFLAVSQRRYKDVTVAGMKHRIRSLTEGEWSDHQAETMGVKNGVSQDEGFRTSDARLIVACVVDSNGQPVFQDTDVARLAYCDAGLVEPLVRAIRVHLGAASVEDSLKNLEATGDGDSPTSSSGQPEPQGATA